MGGVAWRGGFVAAAVSAGLLMYRTPSDRLEVLIAHPGGPLWSKRDDGAWTIPKGLREADEDLAATAAREFVEETGFAVPATGWIPLGSVRQRSGKTVHAWAVPGEAAPAELRSNPFEMEWPPRSGRRQEFPEIDRVAWCEPEIARRKLNPAQSAFIDRLLEEIDIK